MVWGTRWFVDKIYWLTAFIGIANIFIKVKFHLLFPDPKSPEHCLE